MEEKGLCPVQGVLQSNNQEEIKHYFYRCDACGTMIKPRWMRKARKDGTPPCHKCGANRFKPAVKVPFWPEFVYLIFHLRVIKKTIFNPYNWNNIKSYFVPPEDLPKGEALCDKLK